MHLTFTPSEPLTFGLELEFQLIDAATGLLSPSALTLLECMRADSALPRLALEATLSTLEINSAIARDADALLSDVMGLTQRLADAARSLGLIIRGGGTHLTQFWNERITSPTERAHELSKRYGFLPKRFSTYGMHVHIGMPDAHTCIHVANHLQALVPLFIALSAASPFLQMSDTGLAACRPLETLAYPHGGPMPRLQDWQALEDALAEITATGLAFGMKDVYWDVRPKPEFGTVEVRVFDTPLSVRKAVELAALTRGCAALVLAGHLVLPAAPPSPVAERSSRFLACRDAMDASLYNPMALQWQNARAWFDDLASAIHEVTHLDAATLSHIAALQSRIASGEQEFTLMREAWASLQQTGWTMDERRAALPAYSLRTAERLLA